MPYRNDRQYRGICVNITSISSRVRMEPLSPSRRCRAAVVPPHGRRSVVPSSFQRSTGKVATSWSGTTALLRICLPSPFPAFSLSADSATADESRTAASSPSRRSGRGSRMAAPMSRGVVGYIMRGECVAGTRREYAITASLIADRFLVTGGKIRCRSPRSPHGTSTRSQDRSTPQASVTEGSTGSPYREHRRPRAKMTSLGSYCITV